jgi:hypothetical protein
LNFGEEGKSKVVPVLKQALRHEDVLGVEVQRQAFLKSALEEEREWLASHAGSFTLGERAFGTHWIGKWVRPRGGLDAAEKRKIPSPCRELNPRITII